MPIRPAPGLCVTVYSGGGLVSGTAESRAILVALAPQIVMLHGDTSVLRDCAAMVRADVPGVRLWTGVGIDSLATSATTGRMTPDAVVEEFVRRAQNALAAGCELVVWDAEEQWKTGANAHDPHGILPALARRALLAVAARVPIAQAFTSYGVVTEHSTFPWEAFVGEGSPVVVHLPQQYAVMPDPHQRADVADVIARAQWSDRSLAAFVASGRIRADLGPGGAGFGRYLMAYRCATDGLVMVARAAPTAPYVAFWAAPSLPHGRMDSEGYAAILALLRGTPAQSASAMPAVVAGGIVGAVALALWRLFAR